MEQMKDPSQLDDDEYVFIPHIVIKNANGYEAAEAEFRQLMEQLGLKVGPIEEVDEGEFREI